LRCLVFGEFKRSGSGHGLPLFCIAPTDLLNVCMKCDVPVMSLAFNTLFCQSLFYWCDSNRFCEFIPSGVGMHLRFPRSYAGETDRSQLWLECAARAELRSGMVAIKKTGLTPASIEVPIFFDR
jgi:hypothetical protein